MKDNFDKKLSDKIKEVSNSNEIAYNPEHWNMLQDKMNNKKKRLFYYWKIAAVLLISLLLGGIGNYFYNENVNNKNFENPQIILDTKNDSLRIDSLKTNEHIFITSGDLDTLKIKRRNNPSYKKSEHSINLESSIAKNIEVEAQNDKKQLISINSDSLKTNLNSELLADTIVETANKNTSSDSILSEENLTENTIIQQLKKDSLANKKELLAVLEEELETTKQDSKKSIKLGLEVAPIFDYNQDNGSSNVGFAGGISLEIPISNKFDVQTGVFYADQKLNLNQSSVLYSDAVSTINNSQLINGNSSQLINEEAVIKGIEIPLNVKYNFSVAQKDFFISAGVTSTSYIKENIESNYLVNERTEISSQDYLGNNIIKHELVQTNSKITTPANTSKFNFANYLNFSLGIKLPVNNQHQAIIIAPYFKYSLKPITKQQIDFNSGGVHLRYNFSFSKN